MNYLSSYYFIKSSSDFVSGGQTSKAVNSNLPHAVERGVFATKTEASAVLKNLTSNISKNGFPSGSILDPSYVDRVLVSIGNGGVASYQVAKNGTASLKTVLIAK